MADFDSNKVDTLLSVLRVSTKKLAKGLDAQVVETSVWSDKELELLKKEVLKEIGLKKD